MPGHERAARRFDAIVARDGCAPWDTHLDLDPADERLEAIPQWRADGPASSRPRGAPTECGPTRCRSEEAERLLHSTAGSLARVSMPQ